MTELPWDAVTHLLYVNCIYALTGLSRIWRVREKSKTVPTKKGGNVILDELRGAYVMRLIYKEGFREIFRLNEGRKIVYITLPVVKIWRQNRLSPSLSTSPWSRYFGVPRVQHGRREPISLCSKKGRGIAFIEVFDSCFELTMGRKSQTADVQKYIQECQGACDRCSNRRLWTQKWNFRCHETREHFWSSHVELAAQGRVWPV